MTENPEAAFTEHPNLPQGWFKAGELIDPKTNERSILIFNRDAKGHAKDFKKV